MRRSLPKISGNISWVWVCGVNPAAYKELLCIIRYVLDMKNLGLKIEPTGNSKVPWEIVCFSDSDYVGDLVNRRSKNGYILYILGVLVSS